ncbi:2820_t:CDS:1, partial [Ambispora gerdemannii]
NATYVHDPMKWDDINMTFLKTLDENVSIRQDTFLSGNNADLQGFPDNHYLD